MLRLSAVDQHATELGLVIGQPLANVRAMLPSLQVVEADAAADMKLLTSLADWCSRFSPLVALDGACGLLLDVTGASHLFGGEKAMLKLMCDKLRAQGFEVQGALAGTQVSARALACYRDGALVAAGDEAKAVTPLPVEALGLDATISHALRRAGLKTLGQVAKRKRNELVARFGADLLDVLDEALGETARPITPLSSPPDYWQEQNFAEPVISDDAIQASLVKLALDLSKILEHRGQGARRLEVMFFRTDGAVPRIAIEMGAPTRDPAIISRLFREKLAALVDPLDPGFGFDLIRLCASRVEAWDVKVVSLDMAVRHEQEIGFLIDRLAARFGSNRILKFQPRDTHIPEVAWALVPAQYADGATVPWRRVRKAKDAPRRPLRLFARPEPVDCVVPYCFTWRRVRHVMMQCEGPERIAMEWWRQNSVQPMRDYYRVEDNAGRRYWLYRQGVSEQWFMHGIFA